MTIAAVFEFPDEPVTKYHKVFEAGELGGVAYMAMELIHGVDLGRALAERRKQGAPLPVDLGLYIAITLLGALEYAHSALSPRKRPLEIVHSDVSPSNVFIATTGQLKLGDFGVARSRAWGNTEAHAAGKPSYVSPEVLEGQVSAAADLWAAAVVLYELLTLERPFQGKTPEEVMKAIRKQKWKPANKVRREVRPEVQAILERCFEKNPADRFPDAGAFRSALLPLFDADVGTAEALARAVTKVDRPGGSD